VSVQVPATSTSLVTHCTSGLELKLARTVTSRFPTCTLGEFTVIAMAPALLLTLPSGNFCVAVRMCR
jgi:hypothetical protein